MLRVDFGDLERRQTVEVEGRIEPDEQCFTDCPFVLSRPFEFVLTASWVGSDQVVVRGTCRGGVRQDCRRCLQPVERLVDTDITLVFVLDDSLEDGDGDTIGIDSGAREIDLRPHLRDEVIFAIPSFVECRADCKGLCAGCGENLNSAECKCSLRGMDPRWDALRALQNK